MPFLFMHNLILFYIKFNFSILIPISCQFRVLNVTNKASTCFKSSLFHLENKKCACPDCSEQALLITIIWLVFEFADRPLRGSPRLPGWQRAACLRAPSARAL